MYFRVGFYRLFCFNLIYIQPSSIFVKNINPLSLFYARFLRNVLTFQLTIFQVVCKMLCYVFYNHIFILIPLIYTGLNLLSVQSKWLGWNHDAEV